MSKLSSIHRNQMISFFVPGIPATAGSKRAFQNKWTGNINIVPANTKKQRHWMTDVKQYAEDSYKNKPLTGPIKLLIDFYLPRPKNHYRTGKNSDLIKLSAPNYPTTRPDLTKLTRAIEDSIKGVVWVDDSQVVKQETNKKYAIDRIGAHVMIVEL